MCIYKQCCATTASGRCINCTVSMQSDHCYIHRNRSNKLYLQYKQICETAYNLNIDRSISNVKERIKYLTECHQIFVRAYNARLKHRHYAYVPECYDSGHNHQFKIIQDKINKCREKLLQINN